MLDSARAHVRLLILWEAVSLQRPRTPTAWRGVTLSRKAPQRRRPTTTKIIHLPKRADCLVCGQAKAQKRSCIMRTEKMLGRVRSEKFGHVVTTEHIISLSPKAASAEGAASASTFKDIGAGWVECEHIIHRKRGGTRRQLSNNNPGRRPQLAQRRVRREPARTQDIRFEAPAGNTWPTSH